MPRISLFGRKRTERESQIIYLIQSSFGVKPKNLKLYEQALTHKSIVKEKSSLEMIHNERLEFLGDAIISATVADILYQKFPKKSEGELTQMRARIVSRENLNTIGEKLGLEPYIQYHKSKNQYNSLLGNTFESIVGALYIDLGYKKTSKALKREIFNDSLSFDEIVLQNVDFKSQLIIQCQKGKQSISFELIEEITDPDGKLSFCMAVLIDGEEKSRASANTKRKAEQKAAKKLLQLN